MRHELYKSLPLLPLLLIVALCTPSIKAQSDSGLHKRRLSSTVNSFSRIHTPVLSYDGSRLFFSRKFHPENTGGVNDPDDIWFSERYDDTHWSEPMKIDTPINTRLSTVLFSLSLDGNAALLGSTFATSQGIKQVFSIVTLKGTQWLASEPISIREYQNASPYFYASMSPDLKVLLLALQGKNTRGDLDLYVSFREGNSFTWSAPRSLGTTINTAGTEGSPFLGYDGSTLYFSSNGHKGFGSQDLFMTRRLDSTWTKWSEPQNLGAAINTPGLDHCFSLSHDGTTAYIISSDTANPQAGIYAVTIPQPLRIRENVYDHPEQSTPQRDSVRVVFHFAPGSTKIDAQEKDEYLRIIGDRSWQIRGIRFSGHTDSTGTATYNQRLSEQRATRVVELVQANVSGWKLHKGYGAHQPIADNATTKGRAQNRRVEVIIYRER